MSVVDTLHVSMMETDMPRAAMRADRPRATGAEVICSAAILKSNATAQKSEVARTARGFYSLLLRHTEEAPAAWTAAAVTFFSRSLWVRLLEGEKRAKMRRRLGKTGT